MTQQVIQIISDEEPHVTPQMVVPAVVGRDKESSESSGNDVLERIVVIIPKLY